MASFDELEEENSQIRVPGMKNSYAEEFLQNRVKSVTASLRIAGLTSESLPTKE